MIHYSILISISYNIYIKNDKECFNAFYNADQMYYKVIFNIKTNNKANNIARCIYDKIKNIRSENKEWLVNSTNGYIFAHVELPLYEKEYLESVIYEYGIQKAIEKFILLIITFQINIYF